MKKIKPIKPKKSGDILVTKKMLELTERKLSKKITSLSLEMKSQLKTRDARFDKVDARFNTVDARFNEVDARFDKIDSRLEIISSKIDQVLILMEDQNSRNRFVLDGYASLDHRVSKLESSEV